MNRDQIKGAVKEVAGKVQQKAGRFFGSKKQQAKGLETQVEGQAQKTSGDVKDSARKS